MGTACFQLYNFVNRKHARVLLLDIYLFIISQEAVAHTPWREHANELVYFNEVFLFIPNEGIQ